MEKATGWRYPGFPGQGAGLTVRAGGARAGTEPRGQAGGGGAPSPGPPVAFPQPLRRGSHVAQTPRRPFRRAEPKNGGLVPLGPTAPRSESRVRSEPPRRVAWGGVATARSRLPGCGSDAGPWSWSGDSGKRRGSGERRPGTPPRVPASVRSGGGAPDAAAIGRGG